MRGTSPEGGALVYPSVPANLLVWAAVVVAVLNGWIYFRRWRRRVPANDRAA